MTVSNRERTDDEGDRLAALHVGDTDSLCRTITSDDVAAFARLTGDHNALHLDDEFAARTQFEQRVVHGFLHASLLSALVGMKLPGRGALYLSQTLAFTSPVFIGDTVDAKGTIEKIDQTTRIVTIRTKITNQHGKCVLDGMAEVKVLRLANGRSKATIRRSEGMSALLDGKVALVTGASRGIGRAIAATLAAHGAEVWANYHRSDAAAESLVAQIEGCGGKCRMVKADVTNNFQVAAMVEAITSRGALDILVNNAGPRIKSAAFQGLAWDDMSAAFEAIVGSAFHVTRAALPSLKASRGKIINVLSSAALGRTAYNWMPYVTAKAAVAGLTKNLAQELGPAGITVNMVSPSMVDTDLVADVPDKIRQMTISRTPLRRLATVDDVAGAVLFFASAYSNFISGDNLLVTGGDVMT